MKHFLYYSFITIFFHLKFSSQETMAVWKLYRSEIKDRFLVRLKHTSLFDIGLSGFQLQLTQAISLQEQTVKIIKI